ncbi:MAG: HesB/IscA family protein [Thiotrichales bacterium]
MLTVTKPAAEKIREASRQSQLEGAALRIAVREAADGSFVYLMGFDDTPGGDDVNLESEGVAIVIDALQTEKIAGMVIDFVELDNGETNFVFINPNDPSHSAARE